MAKSSSKNVTQEDLTQGQMNALGKSIHAKKNPLKGYRFANTEEDGEDAKDGFEIKYPGRYPKGYRYASKKSGKSTKLDERDAVFEELNAVCVGIHETLGYPTVDWSPNGCVVSPIEVGDAGVSFAIYAPFTEASGAVVGELLVRPEAVLRPEANMLKEKVVEIIRSYAEKMHSITPVLTWRVQEMADGQNGVVLGMEEGFHIGLGGAGTLQNPGLSTGKMSATASLPMGEDDDEDKSARSKAVDELLGSGVLRGVASAASDGGGPGGVASRAENSEGVIEAHDRGDAARAYLLLARLDWETFMSMDSKEIAYQYAYRKGKTQDMQKLAASLKRDHRITEIALKSLRTMAANDIWGMGESALGEMHGDASGLAFGSSDDPMEPFSSHGYAGGRGGMGEREDDDLSDDDISLEDDIGDPIHKVLHQSAYGGTKENMGTGDEFSTTLVPTARLGTGPVHARDDEMGSLDDDTIGPEMSILHKKALIGHTDYALEQLGDTAEPGIGFKFAEEEELDELFGKKVHCKNCGKDTPKNDMRGQNCRKCDNEIRTGKSLPGKDRKQSGVMGEHTCSYCKKHFGDKSTSSHGMCPKCSAEFTKQVKAGKSPKMKVKEETGTDDDQITPGMMGSTEYHSVVAMIYRRTAGGSYEILLGRAVADDDRDGLLACPGGGIDPEDGRDLHAAATREAFEESGVHCEGTGVILDHPRKPGVAFVACLWMQGEPTPNGEFHDMQWFPLAAVEHMDGIYGPNKQVLIQLPAYLQNTGEMAEAMTRHAKSQMSKNVAGNVGKTRTSGDRRPKKVKATKLTPGMHVAGQGLVRSLSKTGLGVAITFQDGHVENVAADKMIGINEESSSKKAKAVSKGRDISSGSGAEKKDQPGNTSQLKDPPEEQEDPAPAIGTIKVLADPGDPEDMEKKKEEKEKKAEKEEQDALGEPGDVPTRGSMPGGEEGATSMELRLPSVDDAQRAHDWFRSLDMEVQMDGAIVRVDAQDPLEVELIARTAKQSFGLDMSGYTTGTPETPEGDQNGRPGKEPGTEDGQDEDGPTEPGKQPKDKEKPFRLSKSDDKGKPSDEDDSE